MNSEKDTSRDSIDELPEEKILNKDIRSKNKITQKMIFLVFPTMSSLIYYRPKVISKYYNSIALMTNFQPF